MLNVEQIDIVATDPRRGDYLKVNPFGSTPALELDDGRVITEALTIGEYLNEIGEGPELVGTTPEERATARMWARRVDLGFIMPIILGFRAHAGREMFAPRLRVAPASASVELTAMGFDFLDQIEAVCSTDDYLAGDRFTLGDITLLCFVDFCEAIGLAPRDGRPWLTGWYDRVSTRPSMAA